MSSSALTATGSAYPSTSGSSLSHGRRPWVVLAGAAGASGVALGLTASHGIFAAADARTEVGLLLVAVSTCLQFGLGPVVGAMSDRFGVRRVVAAGAGALALGGTAAGELPEAAAALAYATGTGVAGACTLTPLMATVSAWFGRHRTLALGLLLAGSGAGSLVLPHVLRTLLEAHGLGGAWRTAALCGAVLMLAGISAVVRPASTPVRAPDAAPWRTSWREAAGAVARDRFLRRFFISGLVSTAGGGFVPSTFLVPLAVERGLSSADGAALVSLFAVASMMSRLFLPALLATRWTPYQVYLRSHLVLAVCYVPWATSALAAGSLLVFVVAFGVAFGIWTTVAPAVVAEACPERVGTVLGFVYSAPAVGGPLAAVVAGLLWRVSGDAAWLALLGCSSLVLAWWLLASRSASWRP